MNDTTFITLLTTIPVSSAIIFLIWKFGPTIISLFKGKQEVKSGNGNGNGKLTAIDEKLDLMMGNHMSHLEEGMRNIRDSVDKINDTLNRFHEAHLRNHADIREALSYLKARVDDK